MKIFDPKLTGSIEILNTISGNVTIAGGLTVEGSLGGSATTASYVEYSDVVNKPTLVSSSAQIASDISGSFTNVSSSLEQRVSANEGSVSSLNSASSSYLLNSTDTLTGDLTVTGTITAQEFHTEFVSASILYDSGSTKFGNSLDDVHSFTGSAFIEPGLTVTGDGNNHILKAVRAGSTRLFVGNGVNTVGINTETVNNPLTVNGGADFSGNVGIGITTPASGRQLHISSTSTGVVRVESTAATNGEALYELFGTNSSGTQRSFIVKYDNADVFRIGTAQAVPIRFETNDTERMSISSTGVATFLSSVTATTFNTTGVLNLNSQNGFQIGADAYSGGFYVYDNTAGVYRFKISNGGTAAFSSDITTAGDLFINSGTNYNDKGYIYLSNQRTAIVSDIVNLTANGDTSLDFQTRSGGSTSSAMFIDEFRRVGIGTASPSSGAKLDVNGSLAISNSGQINLTRTLSTNNLWYGLRYDNNEVQIYTYNAGGRSITFNTVYGGTDIVSQLMKIQADGSVGIGTTDPQAKLDVNGVIMARDEVIVSKAPSDTVGAGPNIYLAGGTGSSYTQLAQGVGRFTIWGYDGSWGEKMTIRHTDGYMGIGVISPSYKLHVAGDIYSTDTVYGRNVSPTPWVTVTAGSPTGATIPYGYSVINVSSLCDNTWRDILTVINDTKAYIWATVGDAASKDMGQWFMMMTSPAYGVSNFGSINYQDNGWNTGDFDLRYVNGGSGTYHLQLRATSYYSAGNTANGKIYFLRFE